MKMRSCHQTIELLSASMDQDLTKFQRLAFRIHLWACRSCARMHKQFQVLRAAGRQLRTDKSSLLNLLNPDWQKLLAKQTKL